ncbi:hypothetical protein HY375_01155 [Candidatus Berkelbacteria bacterium]|nr:hypothetical protein [Candidatus Berkelbacteria bacterium]
MYYYISEAPRSRDDQRALEHVRGLLTSLGIAGEFVSTSPARTVEELAEIGAAKKYSTIVALGSDDLINRVAALLAGTSYVFGAIPLQHPRALELVSGITSLEEAAEALKYRRVRPTAITRIEPNKFLLTEARIQLARATPLRLTVDDCLVTGDCTDIRFAGNGRIVVNNRYATGGRVTQFFNWFRGAEPQSDRFTSHFSVQRAVIELDGTYPAYVGREVFAKTPLALTVLPGVLKMITRRDRLAASQTAH